MGRKEAKAAMVEEMNSSLREDKDMDQHSFVFFGWPSIGGFANTDNKGFMLYIKYRYPLIQQSLLLTLDLLSNAS